MMESNTDADRINRGSLYKQVMEEEREIRALLATAERVRAEIKERDRVSPVSNLPSD
jgi:hypothetical protein